jgi:hypothetical protein
MLRREHLADFLCDYVPFFFSATACFENLIAITSTAGDFCQVLFWVQFFLLQENRNEN